MEDQGAFLSAQFEHSRLSGTFNKHKSWALLMSI
jgi:hypothetical protein